MTKLEIKINPADSTDAANIAHVYCTAWKFAYKGIFPQNFLDSINEEVWTARFTESINLNKSQFLVAKTQGVLTGIIDVYYSAENSNSREIRCIYVHPEYIRQGIGSALFNFIIQSSAASRISSLFLWSHPNNIHATNFYFKMGFSKVAGDRSIEIEGQNHKLVKFSREVKSKNHPFLIQ